MLCIQILLKTQILLWIVYSQPITQKNNMTNLADLRDQFISHSIPGKTFAEVGGLWGTINEKVSVAHKYNATSLTMIDVSPEDGELWQKFDQRMRDLGITEYRCISQDICSWELNNTIEPFDVVHCSGVLYHHANPMIMLESLYKITRCHLILTSAITQELIENEQGRYQIPPSSVIFVPSLNERERAILKTYWQNTGVTVAYGITEKVTYNLEDFGPWWWLPTASAMRAMCEATGFKVIDSGLTWNNNAQTLLLSV